MSLLRTLATTFNARRRVHDGESQGREQGGSGVLRRDAESSRQEGYESLFVTAPDDLRLHVRIYGARTATALPVVCLPGLARTAADFHDLATALAAAPAKPRLVVTLDYRGHGRSDYDSQPRNYGLGRDLADLVAVLAALNIVSAIVVGTSHGGVLALMLARARPSLIAGAILNDIGPVIEPRAVLQMKGYIGKLPVPRDFAEGGEILRQLFGARFPKLTARDWTAFAQRTWREHRGALAPDYDVRLARTLEANWEHSPTTLWEAFDALAGVPLMIIRGACSTMLSPATLDAMLARRAALNVAVVPDQGHAPILDEPKLLRRMAAFVASCDVPDTQPDRAAAASWTGGEPKFAV